MKIIRNQIICNNDHYIENTFEKEHSPPLFKNLKILNIYDVFKVEALKFVYDSLNRNNPTQFHEFFSLYNNPNMNTNAHRNKHLIRPNPRTSNYGIKSLKYTGVVLWNELPLNIRTLLSKKSFYKSLKVILLDTYE